MTGYRQLEVPCEHGNDPSGSLKYGKFLDWLSFSRKTLLHGASSLRWGQSTFAWKWAPKPIHWMILEGTWGNDNDRGKLRYRCSEKNFVITTVSTNPIYTALEANPAILR
jgi:hypothetical protein